MRHQIKASFALMKEGGIVRTELIEREHEAVDRESAKKKFMTEMKEYYQKRKENVIRSMIIYCRPIEEEGIDKYVKPKQVDLNGKQI